MSMTPESNVGAHRELKSLQIVVQADKCVGAGHCVTCASDVFTQDDDGVVVLLEEHPSPQRLEAVESAARMCPTSAIEIHKGW
jgi:ferredoxin